MQKKEVKRVTTRSTPCVEYQQKACQEIETNEKIAKSFNCKIPFLNTGVHLNEIFHSNLPNCSDDIIRNAWKFDENIESYCTSTLVCESSRFSTTMRVYENYSAQTVIEFSYTTPEVEHHLSYINYDLQNLIGEIGGLLGITLGLSGLSIFQLMLTSIQRLGGAMKK